MVLATDLRWVARNARGVLLAEDTAAGVCYPLTLSRPSVLLDIGPTAKTSARPVHLLQLGSFLRQTAAPDPLYRDSALLTINSHPSNEGTLHQIMSKVIKALSFESITHLDLRLVTHLTPISCRTALNLLPALDMIYLTSNKVQKLHSRAARS
ncbi:hypothetical protein C8R44DRAFT_873291 [Mycena epipterygia]|nr:hypothetical protein C8R44DRAFT_873291 [Mycena epipterygia]